MFEETEEKQGGGRRKLIPDIERHHGNPLLTKTSVMHLNELQRAISFIEAGEVHFDPFRILSQPLTATRSKPPSWFPIITPPITSDVRHYSYNPLQIT